MAEIQYFKLSTFFQIFNILIGNKWINALNNRLLDISSTYEHMHQGLCWLVTRDQAAPAPHPCFPSLLPVPAPLHRTLVRLSLVRRGHSPQAAKLFLPCRRWHFLHTVKLKPIPREVSPSVLPASSTSLCLCLSLPSFEAQLRRSCSGTMSPRLLSLCSWILSLSLSWFLPSSLEKVTIRNFPDGPVVRTPSCQCKGHGFDPWLGN